MALSLKRDVGNAECLLEILTHTFHLFSLNNDYNLENKIIDQYDTFNHS